MFSETEKGIEGLASQPARFVYLFKSFGSEKC